MDYLRKKIVDLNKNPKILAKENIIDFQSLKSEDYHDSDVYKIQASTLIGSQSLRTKGFAKKELAMGAKKNATTDILGISATSSIVVGEEQLKKLQGELTKKIHQHLQGFIDEDSPKVSIELLQSFIEDKLKNLKAGDDVALDPAVEQLENSLKENKDILKGIVKESDIPKAIESLRRIFTENLYKEVWALNESPRLIARAVASSELDKHLGTHVLSEEVFAEHDHGIVGVSVAVDGVPITQEKKINNQGVVLYHDINFADPRIQKGLSDLQVIDYLTGQLDRGQHNIFIDEKTGQVKGIDNDMAFGGSGADKASRNTLTTPLPKQIDHETAKKVSALKPSELENLLNQSGHAHQRLNSDEIAKAKERLTKLQTHISDIKSGRVLGGSIVPKWDEQTYKNTIENDKDERIKIGTNLNAYHGSSYVARAQFRFENAGTEKGQKAGLVHETKEEKQQRLEQERPRTRVETLAEEKLIAKRSKKTHLVQLEEVDPNYRDVQNPTAKEIASIKQEYKSELARAGKDDAQTLLEEQQLKQSVRFAPQRGELHDNSQERRRGRLDELPLPSSVQNLPPSGRSAEAQKKREELGQKVESQKAQQTKQEAEKKDQQWTPKTPSEKKGPKHGKNPF